MLQTTTRFEVYIDDEKFIFYRFQLDIKLTRSTSESLFKPLDNSEGPTDHH